MLYSKIKREKKWNHILNKENPEFALWLHCIISQKYCRVLILTPSLSLQLHSTIYSLLKMLFKRCLSVTFRPQLRWRSVWLISSSRTHLRTCCRWPTGSSASSTTRSQSCPETAWPNLVKASSPPSTSMSCRKTLRNYCTKWAWV